MSASKNKIKTVATAADPAKFIDKVKNEGKRKDSHELVALMQDVTGESAKMWGSAIVGFGTRHYQYASGSNKLDDVDRKVLRKLIEYSIK